MSEPDNAAQFRRLQAALHRIRDQIEVEIPFDALILAVTYSTEDGATAYIQANSGNYYARTGLMNRMLTKRREDAACDTREQREDTD